MASSKRKKKSKQKIKKGKIGKTWNLNKPFWESLLEKKERERERERENHTIDSLEK